MNRQPRHTGPHAGRRGLISACALLAAIGLVAWLLTGSSPSTRSTSAASPSANQSTSAVGTTSTSPSPKPSATGPCASPAACGFPGAADTGPGATALKDHSGNLEIRQNGEVISGWQLSGSLDVYANDVTIVDSRIDSTTWWGVNLRSGYTGLRILHSLLTGTPGAGADNGGEDYAVSNMGSGSIEVGWDDVSVFANALSMGHGYIHDNYVHDLTPFINRAGTYAHIDAIISDGDDTLGLRVEHNTLLNPVKADQGPTSVIGLLPNTGPISNTTITRNWLAGGAYALYGGGVGATHVVVTGNVFSTQYWPKCGVYGAVAYWNTRGSGNVWASNRYSSNAMVGIPRQN